MIGLLKRKLFWTVLGLMTLPAGIDNAAAADAVFKRTPVQVEHVRLVSAKSFA